MSRFNRVLRALFSASEPTEAELTAIEQGYRRRIDGTSTARRRAWWPAVAAILVLALVVVSLQPAPVVASLNEIAQAARTVEPASLSNDAYFYTESTSTFGQTISLDDESELTYLIDEHREVWINPAGTEVVIRTTRNNPVFESEDDRMRYFDAGLDGLDNLDVTQTAAVDGVTHDATDRPWPLAASELLQEVRDQPNVTTDTQAAIQLLNLIIESPAPPELRAATIEAIAQLDLELVGENDQGTTVRTVPTESDAEIVEFTLDPQGQLRRRIVKRYDPNDPSTDETTLRVDYTPTALVEGPPGP